MANEFWVNDRQWSAIEPLLPRNQPGARRVDDRRVISGIVHVLKVGCRWEDCPALYGPSTTIYNRFNRWSRRGLWQRLFDALVTTDAADTQIIDSTTAKAHRSAGGGKGGLGAGYRSLARRADDENPRRRRLSRQAHRLRNNPGPARRCARRRVAPMPAARLCIADTAYDSNGLRQFLSERGTQPVIPNNPTRKRFHSFDADIYKRRNLIERMFCRLKDWRRIATRYDRLAANFAAAVAIATIVLWWT